MNDRLADLLEDGEAERLATGFEFTEGPLWHPEGFYSFSDIRANIAAGVYDTMTCNMLQWYVNEEGDSGRAVGAGDLRRVGAGRQRRHERRVGAASQQAKRARRYPAHFPREYCKVGG